ncbi:MAG: LapA family protein [Actinomycetota bacterium]|nr:LapA family protein [Actinomycetota bacterium]
MTSPVDDSQPQPGDVAAHAGGALGTPSPASMQRADPGYAMGPTPITTPAGLDEHGRVQRGKISAVWSGLIIAALLLIALIAFIAQNSRQVAIHFLGFSGHIALGLALLIASVSSVLLVAIPGTLRILQLRRALRKNAVQPN